VRAVQVTGLGGPGVLEVVDLADPVPGTGQVLIEVDHAGINFGDTHQAAGTYLVSHRVPFTLGSEVVGRVAGSGRRVLALVDGGGYAERVVAQDSLVFDLPDTVDDGAALAVGVAGLTAWHLLTTCAHLMPGESVVVQAAAGGVGSVAVQLATAWGAGRVIATASTPAKRALAVDLGADVAVDSEARGLSRSLKTANGGRLVDVVLEMAWGRSFDLSIIILAPFGRLVTYGSASRQPTRPIHPGELMARGRSIIGFWLGHCFPHREMLKAPLDALFDMVEAGDLRPVVGNDYRLQDAAQAHTDLLARRTTGKQILDPRA
jgi:NADPH2:quinone reductase